MIQTAACCDSNCDSNIKVPPQHPATMCSVLLESKFSVTHSAQGRFLNNAHAHGVGSWLLWAASSDWWYPDVSEWLASLLRRQLPLHRQPGTVLWVHGAVTVSDSQHATCSLTGSFMLPVCIAPPQPRPMGFHPALSQGEPTNDWIINPERHERTRPPARSQTHARNQTSNLLKNSNRPCTVWVTQLLSPSCAVLHAPCSNSNP